jgi:hypothetical protein
MPWSACFDEPIVLPDGGELRTLLDVGHYVDKLPRSMHEREEWQTVMEVLLSAVEGREPVSLLRIALKLALQEKRPRASQEIEDDPIRTVWIYIDTSEEVDALRRHVELPT